MKVELILGADAAHAPAVQTLASEQRSPLVIANEPSVRDAVLRLGVPARTFTEQVPVDSPEDFAAYEAAHTDMRELSQALEDVRYRGVPIIGALEAQVVADLVFFLRAISAAERARRDGVSQLLLVLTHFNATYTALLDALALEPHERGRIRIARGTELTPLDVPLVDDEAYRALATSAVPEPRAGAVPPWLPQRIVSLLYLLTNDADLYMRPVYPLIEEFVRARTEFLVLTEDDRVVRSLTSRSVPVVDVRQVRRPRGLVATSERQHRESAIAAFLTRLRIAGDRLSDDALRALTRSQANDAAVARIDEWMATVDVMDAVLRWGRPRSIFLMPDAMQSSVMVTRLGRSYGIPSITTVAASVAGTARALGTYRADFVACYGTECVEAFRAIGWSPSRIVLTGAPALDAAATIPRDRDRAVVLAHGRLDPARPIVVIATSRPSAAEDTWILELARAASRTGWQLILRPHPLHGDLAYARVLSEAEGQLRTLPDLELRPVLHAADVVVTDYSHAGREALALGRPLVAVNVSGSPYPNNRYDEEGVAVPATSGPDVVIAVERLLTDTETIAALARAREASVDRFNWKNDGRAARRLYELLVEPPVRVGGTP